MSEFVRVGVIGCGNVVARGHTPALLELEEVKNPVSGFQHQHQRHRQLFVQEYGGEHHGL